MKQYSFFTNRTWSSHPKRNIYWHRKLALVFGPNSEFSMIRIEEKLTGAALCYSELKNRSNLYTEALEGSYTNPIGHHEIKKLHIYEYFFFTCCNYIYKELLNIQTHNKVSIPQPLMDKLCKLNNERRVQEHGKDWYWGEKSSRKVAQEGINYDFKSNMKLLDEIYDYLIKIVKKG